MCVEIIGNRIHNVFNGLSVRIFFKHDFNFFYEHFIFSSLSVVFYSKSYHKIENCIQKKKKKEKKTFR